MAIPDWVKDTAKVVGKGVVKYAKIMGRELQYMSEYTNYDIETLNEIRYDLECSLSDFEGDPSSQEYAEFEREVRERKTAIRQVISMKKRQNY